MNDKKTILAIIFALVLAITASIVVVYNRINVEKMDNIVDVAVDHGDIERLSILQGMPVKDLLAAFREAGATSIALTEDLANNTDINILSGVDPKKLDLYIPSKGLLRSKLSLIQDAGLRVIPRIRNVFNISGTKIIKKLNNISEFDTVIFAEEEVLGYPNYIKETARVLKAKKIRYGFIEFGKQLGDVALSSYSGQNYVKVHSIPQEEMDNLSRPEMLQRFMRSVRERGIRIVYVHLIPYPDNGKDLLTTNTRFLNVLKKELNAAGFITGIASIPGEVKAGSAEKLSIALGTAAALTLLINYFIPVNFLFSAACLALFMLIPSVNLLALVCAIVFPSYAVISLFPVKREEMPYGVISKAISMTMYVAAITVVGGVFIAALLTGKTAFSGVKLALILPLIIVPAYFLLRRENDGKLDLKLSLFKMEELMNINIKMMHVIAFLFVAAAGALFILRSGNFGMPVYGGEKIARNFLENLMVVRPRTKEFLIGYPAIILGAIYYLKGGNKWLWLLLAIGALAPISMINSFCHTHTPFVITLTRSCVGLILGVAVGILAYFAFLLWGLMLLKVKERTQ